MADTLRDISCCLFLGVVEGHAGLLFKLILLMLCIYSVQTIITFILGLHRWSDHLGLAQTKTEAKTKLLKIETTANGPRVETKS